MERESKGQSLFSFPFFHVGRLFHPFRLHPILIARISAEKSFCMPSFPSRCARDTGEHTHRHGIVITVFFLTVSLVVHPHFTAPSFLYFPLLLLCVFFVSSIFFCAFFPFSTIPPLCYVSTPFYNTRNLGVSTHGVSTGKNTEVRLFDV